MRAELKGRQPTVTEDSNDSASSPATFSHVGRRPRPAIELTEIGAGELPVTPGGIESRARAKRLASKSMDSVCGGRRNAIYAIGSTAAGSRTEGSVGSGPNAPLGDCGAPRIRAPPTRARV